jgi:hypothetical protein
VLGIGVADAPETSDCESLVVLDAWQHAVMGEEVDAPTQLASERLTVSQEQRTLSGTADVSDDDVATQVVALQELEPRAAAGRRRLT